MKEIFLKLNFLITKKHRKNLFLLSFLLLIGMILEVFGLGIIVPVISIILQPDFVETNIYVNKLTSFIGPINYFNFISFFLILVIAIYIIKTFFLVFLSLKQNRFLSNLTSYVSTELFSRYLKQPYYFHLNRNSSTLIKNIQVETSFFSIFCMALMTLFTEFFLLMAVAATLIYIEPFGAITIGLFLSTLSIIFFQFTKSKLKFWGIKRQELDDKISKTTVEGLGGIKDLTILGRQNYPIDLFSINNYLKARIVSNQGIILQLPRFYLELLSIIALVSFIFIMVIQNKDTSTLLTTLGVFVAAVFRVIPSMNRIIASYQNLKYYNSSIDILYDEMRFDFKVNSEVNIKDKFIFNDKISISSLNFSYGDDLNILKNINLTIKKGQTIGVIGKSGSGKSTLIDLIIGLHNPSSGIIMVDGISILNNIRGWQDKIGYVGQNIFLKNTSIQDNIAFGLPQNEINNQSIHDSLEAAQLETFVNSLPQGINTIVGERGVQLSGGQIQRIGLARALYNNPELLVLDEATAALDTKTESNVMHSISLLKKEKTIIIIAHRVSTLKDCDIIYEINAGKLSKKIFKK